MAITRLISLSGLSAFTVAKPIYQFSSQRRLVRRFALPDDEAVEPTHFQFSNDTLVSVDIVAKFILPESSIAFGRRGAGAPWMAMPEATMYEDGPSLAPICDVGGAGEVVVFYSISVSHFVKQSPH